MMCNYSELTLILVLCLRVQEIYTVTCPSQDLFEPCTCIINGSGSTKVRSIGCAYSYPLDLEKLFAKLSENIPNDEKHFDSL